MQQQKGHGLGRHGRWTFWRPSKNGVYMETFTIYRSLTGGVDYYAEAIRSERFGGWLWYLYRGAEGIVANGRADSLLDAIDKMDEAIDGGRA